MNVYILGDCQNIQLANNGGRLFTNPPEDIMAIGGGYSISEEIENGDGTFTGEFKLREEIEFPHADLPIRIEIADAAVIQMMFNPMLRAFVAIAYDSPTVKTENGSIIWFRNFVNELATPEETRALLESYGAIIKIKGE